MRQNIILFYGENRVFLNKELDKLVSRFVEKHGDFNLVRITKEDLPNFSIKQELLTLPFLATHKMVILDNIISQDKDADSSNDNNIKNLVDILSQVPDEVIVAVIDYWITDKSRFITNFTKVGLIKKYSQIDKWEVFSYIRERLINIDKDAAMKLIEYKWGDLNKIEKEIEKLELFWIEKRIDINDIIQNVLPEIEVSIFSLVDCVLDFDSKCAIDKLEILNRYENIYVIYSVLMTNIRNYLYICKLHLIWKKREDIISDFWFNYYVVDKNIWKINSFQKISRLYWELIEIDYESKIWDLIWSSEDALKLKLQKVFLNLKK